MLGLLASHNYEICTSSCAFIGWDALDLLQLPAVKDLLVLDEAFSLACSTDL